MAGINMVREDGLTKRTTTVKSTVIKPTTTTKTTTRTERDEDVNGKGMNTKVTTTVNTVVDTSGNKTTSTAIVSTPVNNKGVPTQPTNTKTTIIKEEPADGSTPKITAVTERVSMEKTDEGFITHTKTTTTDVPTQESTTQFTTSENFTTKEKTDEGFITHDLTITRDDTTGDIVADKTTQTSTIQNTTSSVEKTDDGFIRTDTTYTRDANTGDIVDAYSVTTTPTPRPVPTTKPVESEESSSFWDTVADKLNNSEDVLPGLGTNGLGGGNAPVVTPPMSVITSDNPQDLLDFYQGVAYSMGAGGIAAGAVLTGGAVIPQIVSLAGAGGSAITATSLAQATAAYGGATLATFPTAAQATLAYGSSALILGGTAYATNDCIKSNDPGSPACVGLVTGYQTDPVGFNQALSDSAETLITRPLNNALNSALDNSLSVLDDIKFGNVDAPKISLQTATGIDQKMFGPSEALSPLSRYVTGYGINDPELIERLLTDPKIIQNKYGLPPQQLRIDDPAEYLYQLEQIAKQNQVEIRSIGEIPKFFEEYPQAGAVHAYPGGVITGDHAIYIQPQENLALQAKDATHELVHALQFNRYPGMPIEGKEYEAYLSTWVNPQNVAYSAEIRETFFDMMIGGSSRVFYTENQIPIPWQP